MDPDNTDKLKSAMARLALAAPRKPRRNQRHYVCTLDTSTCRYVPRRFDLLNQFDSIKRENLKPEDLKTWDEANEEARSCNASLAQGRRNG